MRSFRRWAEGSPIGERVESVYRTLEEEVLPHRRARSGLQQMQSYALERKAADMEAFAKMLGVDVRDEEVVRRAMTERTTLTPATFDPMFLWDRRIEVEPPQGGPVNPQTQTMFIPTGWWPYLGWAGWITRAAPACSASTSSATAPGSAAGGCG